LANNNRRPVTSLYIVVMHWYHASHHASLFHQRHVSLSYAVVCRRTLSATLWYIIFAHRCHLSRHRLTSTLRFVVRSCMSSSSSTDKADRCLPSKCLEKFAIKNRAIVQAYAECELWRNSQQQISNDCRL